jgi:hypothetical protein
MLIFVGLANWLLWFSVQMLAVEWTTRESTSHHVVTWASMGNPKRCNTASGWALPCPPSCSLFLAALSFGTVAE